MPVSIPVSIFLGSADEQASLTPTSDAGWYVISVSHPDYSVSWCYGHFNNKDDLNAYLQTCGVSEAHPTGCGVASGPYQDEEHAQFAAQALGPTQGCGGPIRPPAPTPSPSPGIVPIISSQIQPGSSCDNPLFIQWCQQGKPTPTPGPEQQPPPEPQPGPQPGPVPVPTSGQWISACGTDNCQDLITAGVPDVSAIFDAFNQLGDALTNVPVIGTPIRDFFQAAISNIGNIILPSNCYSDSAGQAALARVVLGLIEHFTHGAPEITRNLEYIINCQCQTELPTAGDANECILSGSILPNEWQYWVNAHGFCAPQWSKVLDSRREKLQTHELIQYGRRSDWTDEQIAGELQKQGWLRPNEVAARVQLYDEIPTVSDFLHFLQRNVFDQEYVNYFGLLEGFSERFWATYEKPLRAIGLTEYWASQHYAAHWINPAPGQLLEMVYRLREDKEGVENPFTLDDYERILVEQDVAPYFRKRFREIAYRVPALGYIRDMYRSYVLDREELLSIHQDLGYSPEWSERFVQIDELVRARQRASETHGWTPAAIAKAFVSGQMTAEDTVTFMKDLGYNESEAAQLRARALAELQFTVFSRARSRTMFKALSTVSSAMEAGILSRDDAVATLTNLGWQEKYAQGWAGLEADTAKIKLVKAATAKVRSAFLSGAVDAAYARTALDQLGITAAAQGDMLTAWTLALTPQRKQRSAGQITRDLCSGEITTADALVRLTNLGYNDADQRLYLADAQKCVVQRQQKALSLQDKSDKAAAKAIAAELGAVEKQRKQLLAGLKKAGSLSNLKKWAKLGIIGRDFFFRDLRLQGYDDITIERHWLEACEGKHAACKETTPAVPSPPSG